MKNENLLKIDVFNGIHDIFEKKNVSTFIT